MHSHQGKYILYYINHQSINPLTSINHLTSINQTIGINDNMIQQLSINIYGSRPAIMASKNATGTSINVRQQNDSLTPKLSKEMKNVREWKSVEGENKQEYSWFVKDKQ
jgi:hypothetical protein